MMWHSIIYFFIVLLVMPGVHWLWIEHGKSLHNAIYGVYFLFGVVMYFVFKVLTGGGKLEWWGALAAAFLAIFFYDKFFAVRFQGWFEGK